MTYNERCAREFKVRNIVKEISEMSKMVCKIIVKKAYWNDRMLAYLKLYAGHSALHILSH